MKKKSEFFQKCLAECRDVEEQQDRQTRIEKYRNLCAEILRRERAAWFVPAAIPPFAE